MPPKNQWKRVLSAATDNVVFERSLGQLEQVFYWYSARHRACDVLRHAELEVDSESTSRERTLSLSNLTSAWLELKQRYPLLGASLEERSQDDIVFVVDPARLLSASSTEIVVERVQSLREADQFVEGLHNGKSPLSNDQLACVLILRRTDKPNHVHLLIRCSHVVCDGAANNTLVREYLDLLCNPGSPNPVVEPLEDRLWLSSASEDLHPNPNWSLAKGRWRKAIAKVIAERRLGQTVGGQTLPRKVTSNTTHTPAYARVISSFFSVEDSERMVQSCRANGLTVGSALPILSQIAMARVLCKQYLEGKMPLDEWEFRKAEPINTVGPLNLRPFLVPQWFKNGGAMNVSLAIGHSAYRLPFMPLGGAANLRPGSPLPNLLDMFSKARFLLRCRMTKRSVVGFMQHPLFLEMDATNLPIILEHSREAALRSRAGGILGEIPSEAVSPRARAERECVITHGGATLGNLDTVLPWEYRCVPIDGEVSNEATLKLIRMRSSLTCPPGDLYLSASTFRKQMQFYVYWDDNVYEESIVEGWLKEVVGCAKVYLAEEASA